MQSFDPLVSLSVPQTRSTTTTALTFLGSPPAAADDDDDDDSDSDDSSIALACQAILQLQQDDNDYCSWNTDDDSPARRSNWLASGHANGDCWLWDVRHRAVLRPLLQQEQQPILTEDATSRSSILALESLQKDDSILVQRRNGTLDVVAVATGQAMTHHLERSTTTFCAVAPCREKDHDHLLAVPGGRDCAVHLVDWRQPSGGIAQVVPIPSRQNDMVTSLAFPSSHVVCVGMDSGQLHCCDIRGTTSTSSIQLGQEPILSLDCSTTDTNNNDLILLAGLAGNAHDLAETADPADRGRVVVVTRSSSGALAIRSRIATTHNDSYYYKSNRAGVAVVRFRPHTTTTGSIFGVGGWDHRLRIYELSSSSPTALTARPRAVLRGHRDSITAMAWERTTGLLATACAEGPVLIWNVR